jgi:hypothetical protein
LQAFAADRLIHEPQRLLGVSKEVSAAVPKPSGQTKEPRGPNFPGQQTGRPSVAFEKFVIEVRDGNAGPSTPLKNASLRMTAYIGVLKVIAYIEVSG